MPRPRLVVLAAFAALPAAGCGDNLNVAPDVADVFTETAEDTPVDVQLTASDANEDSLTFDLVQSPMNGTASGSGPSFTYTPDPNFFGTDRFIVTVSDGTIEVPQVVTILVTPVNDPPTIAAIGDQSTDEDTPLGPLTLEITDIDNDLSELAVSASSGDQALIADSGLAVDAGALTLTITPNADANGDATIAVSVDDGEAQVSTQFGIAVLPVNDAPTIGVITDQSTQQAPVGPVTFTVDDIDTPVSSLTVSATSSDQSVVPDGNLSVGGAGATRDITLTPTAGGTATITVTVDDGALTGETTFTFEVTNQAPTAGADSYVATGNTPLSVGVGSGVLANDDDADGDGLTLTPIAGGSTFLGGRIDLASDGSFTYVPPTGQKDVADSFTYTINDGLENATGTATLNLSELVWYVDNAAPAGGDGSFLSHFDTLAAAESASGAGDIIYVFAGDGTTAGQDAGITLQDDQQLIGEGVDLVVNGTTIVAAGTAPAITNSSGFGVKLDANAANHTIAGLTIDAPTDDGISGTNVLSLDVHDVTINIGGNSAVDISNNNPSGTVTIDVTDCTVTGDTAAPQLGFDISFGLNGGDGTLELDMRGNQLSGVDIGVLVETRNDTGTGAGGPNQITLDGNVIEDFTGDGIKLFPNDNSVDQIVVNQNTLTGAGLGGGAAAIEVPMSVEVGTTDLTISDNTITGSDDEGIFVGGSGNNNAGTLNLLVSGNVISSSVSEGLRVTPDDTATYNVTALGNTLSGNGSETTFEFASNAGATMRMRLENNEDDQGYVLDCDANGSSELGGINGQGTTMDCSDPAEDLIFIAHLDDQGNTTLASTPVGSLTGGIGTIPILIIDPLTVPQP